MPSSWKEYQEEAASLFRSLGLDASVDVTIKGVRTTHDIDVLVKSHHVGFEITWVVECKRWNRPVSKLHVLALREIITDVGADRGILLSEAGFQSGAIEAANLTNVKVTSISEIRDFSSNDIFSMRMRDLYDRIELCNTKYWDIPKDHRIEFGLRPDVGQFGYSAARIIEICKELFSQSFRNNYPFGPESLASLVQAGFPEQFRSHEEVVAVVEPMINELEKKLRDYEVSVRGP